MFNLQTLPLNILITFFLCLIFYLSNTFKFRKILLLCLSNLFIFLVTQDIFINFYYFIFTVFIYLLLKFQKNFKFSLAWVFVFVLIIIYKFFSNDIFEDKSVFFILGFSFVSLKAIDLLIEISRERINKINLNYIDISNYLLFFPTIIQGPINRSIDFYNQYITNPKKKFQKFEFAWIIRFLHGIIKVLLFAPILFSYSLLNEEIIDVLINSKNYLIALTSACSTYLFIYMQFSGLSDIAIILSELVGIKSPENFNCPLKSKNPQEFWQRWHMSLTRFIQDHIFFNLAIVIKKKYKINNELTLINSIFVSFVLIGFWHGMATNWLIYGLYHAIGVYIFSTAKGNYLVAIFNLLPNFFKILLTNLFVSFSMFFIIPLSTLTQIIT